MNQNLKQAICERFESRELTDDQLARLELQISASTAPRPYDQKGLNRIAWIVAAAAAVILSIGGILVNQLYLEYRGSILLEAIAAEVADNHLKLKPLEVESQSLHDVLSFFDRLEFQTLESSRIAGNDGDRLLGGRYCSIQGIDAAQLRVASADGKLSTWYQATLPPDKLQMIPNLDHGDEPALFSVKGMQVLIWQEQGVVFAETRRPSMSLE